jgi:hypothetical protein
MGFKITFCQKTCSLQEDRILNNFMITACWVTFWFAIVLLFYCSPTALLLLFYCSSIALLLLFYCSSIVFLRSSFVLERRMNEG